MKLLRASPRSWPVAGITLAALSLAVAAIALRFTWQRDLASLHDDSVSYLMIAQALSPFRHASAAVAAAWPKEQYPPFFPLLIALSGGAFDWRLAHALVAVSFAASVFAVGCYARLVIGPATIAVVAAATYALLPGSWLLVKGILSEFPYIALVFAALSLRERYRHATPSRTAVIGLSLLLAAVALTRTIGFVLLAAIALAEGLRFLRERDRSRLGRWAGALVLSLVVAGAWYALRPDGGDDAYIGYGMGVLERASRDGLGAILPMVQANGSAIVDAWLHALLIYWGEAWSPRFLLACAFGALGLGALILRAIRGEADGLYFILFVAVLLLWPFTGQMYRLAFPLVPLLVVNACWAVAEWIERRRSKARAWWPGYAALTLPFALCLPAVLGYIVQRALSADQGNAPYRTTDIAEYYRMPAGFAAEAYARRQLEVFADMDRIRETTPEGARIMWYTPNYIALLADRRGVPLERPDDAAALAAQLRKQRPDFIYLADVHPRDSPRHQGDPLAPRELARAYTRVVWQRMGAGGELSSILLAVEPDRLDASR